MKGGGCCNEDESGFISTSPRPEVGVGSGLMELGTSTPVFRTLGFGLRQTMLPNIFDSNLTVPQSVIINFLLTLYGPSNASRLTYWARKLVTSEAPGGVGAGVGGAFEIPHV